MIIQPMAVWRAPHGAPANLTKLACGASAEVYAWDVDCVLKLYYRSFPPEAIAREMKNCRIAKDLAIATPTLLSQIEMDGRTGLIFVRIDGPTTYRSIEQCGQSMRQLGCTFFNVQQAIHHCESGELEPLQANMSGRIRHSSKLPVSLKREVINTLLGSPVVNTVCHGDFHPLNVMTEASGPMVVDWSDMARGDPALDVALTLLYLRYGRRGQIPDAVRAEFVDAYVGRCREVWAGRMDQLQHWQRPATAVRLADTRLDDGERAELMGLLEGAQMSWFC